MNNELELYKEKCRQLEMKLALADDMLDNTQSELAHYKEHYLAVLNQRENLKHELIMVQSEYNAIRTAFFWRITKPMRVISNAFRKLMYRFMITRLLFKGLKSLFSYGIKATLQIIKQRRNMLKKAKIDADITMQENEIQRNTKFERDIKFSIVTPLFNTAEKYLTEMIESVQAQTYGNWELCLADGSDAAHSYIEHVCRKYNAKDKRIKYRKLEKNLGIAGNTNIAIEMASGDYFCLLDHDDLLHPSALFCYTSCIIEKSAEILYCHEASFTKRPEDAHLIHYKPIFAPDNLRANNYICHFLSFSRNLFLRSGGGFKSEYDGAQDHDLVFRLTENTQQIELVDKVLYYWRAHADSTASNIGSKAYALKSGIKAVQAHLKRVGLVGDVSLVNNTSAIYRIKYELTSEPIVSIIIPNTDKKDILECCINSIRKKTTYKKYEIIVVENNSIKKEIFEYYDYLKNKGIAKVEIFNEPFNYSKINNFAVSKALGECLLFLNNDIEVITDNWIQELLMFCQRKDIAAVGAMLYYPNNTIQHGGVVFDKIGGVARHLFTGLPRGHGGYMGRALYPCDLSAVTGACLMITKEKFNEVDGFDENLAVAFNDVDLCMKLRKNGYLIVWTPFAELYHHESHTRGYEDTPSKLNRFVQETQYFRSKWSKDIDIGDPYWDERGEG